MPFSRSRSPESMTRSTTAWFDAEGARSGGASRRPAWSCRGRRGRRWRCCAGRRGSAVRQRRRRGVGARSGSGAPGRSGQPIVPRSGRRRPRRAASIAAMTVAAVILSATAEGALAERSGQPRVRRLADLAWSGGALPIVVVSPDPDGAVAAALAGSEAVVRRPGARRGRSASARWSAASSWPRPRFATRPRPCIWPARMTWVGPETITSLIEAHGTDRARCCGRPGTASRAGRSSCRPHARCAAGGRRRPDAARRHRRPRRGRARPAIVELGDPGVIHDARHAEATCRRTKARPIRRPAIPTNGATTSSAEAGLPRAVAGRRRPRRTAAARNRPSSRQSRTLASPVASAEARRSTSADARHLTGDGVSPSRMMASTTVMTGWTSRMTEVRTAGRRGSETWISR